jgi:hypothetical protein
VQPEAGRAVRQRHPLAWDALVLTASVMWVVLALVEDHPDLVVRALGLLGAFNIALISSRWGQYER